MPEEVIKRVEQLGKLDGQPNLLTFTNEDGEKFLDEEDEGYEEDISYGSETEIQDGIHGSMEKSQEWNLRIVIMKMTSLTVMMMII